MTKIAPENKSTDVVFRELSKYTGLNVKYYKENYLLRRLGSRMEKCRAKTFRDYLAHIRRAPAEATELIDTIGINVTDFFRDADVYDALDKEAVPALIKQGRGGNRIRIWSTCCASGEEPYSLGMLLSEFLGEEKALHNITVFATDIDERALSIAQQGRYRAAKFRTMSDRLRNRYFAKSEEDDWYVVSEDLRKMVRFRKYDIISNAPLTFMNLIMCRNMLIYIKQAFQTVIFDKLYQALMPGGFLVLGKTESLPNAYADKFRTVCSVEKIYAKL